MGFATKANTTIHTALNSDGLLDLSNTLQTPDPPAAPASTTLVGSSPPGLLPVMTRLERLKTSHGSG